MIKSRYKLSRHFKLIPNFMVKSPHRTIRTYAIIDSQNRSYEVHRHPEQAGRLVMFDEENYLEKECDLLIEE